MMILVGGPNRPDIEVVVINEYRKEELLTRVHVEGGGTKEPCCKVRCKGGGDDVAQIAIVDPNRRGFGRGIVARGLCRQEQRRCCTHKHEEEENSGTHGASAETDQTEPSTEKM